MSGVDLKPTDWDKRIQYAWKEYETDVSDLAKGFDKEDAKKARQEAIRERLLSKEFGFKEAMAKTKDQREASLRREKADREARLADAKEAEKDRQIRLKIAQIKEDGRASESKPKTLSPQFLEQRASVEQQVQSMVEKGDKSSKITDYVQQNAKYISPEFRKRLKQENNVFWDDKYFMEAPEQSAKRREVEETLGRSLTPAELKWYKDQGIEL